MRNFPEVSPIMPDSQLYVCTYQSLEVWCSKPNMVSVEIASVDKEALQLRYSFDALFGNFEGKVVASEALSANTCRLPFIVNLGSKTRGSANPSLAMVAALYSDSPWRTMCSVCRVALAEKQADA